MKKITFYIYLFYNIGYGQNLRQINILDLKTKVPVEYVSIYNNDTLYSTTDKSGKAVLDFDQKYLFKKNGYYEFYGISENIFLDKIHDNELLDEIVIYAPSKNITKKIGNIEAYAFPIENLEFKAFITPTSKEINRTFSKISFKLKYLNKISRPKILFKLSMYDSSQNLIYTDYLEVDYENENLEFNIKKNILFNKNGIYIGIELLNLSNEINYSTLLSFDLFCSNQVLYKKNYVINSQYENFNDIENSDLFSTMYKSFPEPILKKFKNIYPYVEIKLY